MKLLTKASAILVAALIGPLSGPTAQATSYPHVERAYTHLDEAMDEWAQGSELRVPSSYHRGPQDGWDNSQTYDNALVIIAYTNRPNHSASLRRAVTMGDALLKMQDKDPIGDGRLRDAYGPDQLFASDGTPNIQTWGSAAGNVTWAGMALAHLAHATGESRFRHGAARIGDWLLRHTRDSRGAGGFTGGYEHKDGRLLKYEWKSTEHNADMVGLFGMLHELTGDRKWKDARSHAERLLRSVWLKEKGRFALGTHSDGVSINDSSFIPEDTQSWSFLALQDKAHAPGLDWNLSNLQVTDKRNKHHITGVQYGLRTKPEELAWNDKVVWLEGTAHMALALRCNATDSHKAKSEAYLSHIEGAQRYSQYADGKGIQAYSSMGHSGGRDDDNSPSLHTGATAWYLMAKQGINPFRLNHRC